MFALFAKQLSSRDGEGGRRTTQRSGGPRDGPRSNLARDAQRIPRAAPQGITDGSPREPPPPDPSGKVIAPPSSGRCRKGSSMVQWTPQGFPRRHPWGSLARSIGEANSVRIPRGSPPRHRKGTHKDEATKNNPMGGNSSRDYLDGLWCHPVDYSHHKSPTP